MHDERAAAIAAARAGASVVRTRADDTGPVRSKSSRTDLVTEVDIASGVAVVRALLDHDPAARIVVEEDEVYDLAGTEPGDLDGPEVWIIDPVDGTTSFVHGFPAYSVSVALLRDGVPVAGAICDVPRDMMTSGAMGLGADLDGRPIRCSRTNRLAEALLVTGFPYDRGLPLDRQLAVLGAFLRAPVHGVRRDGSAALDCCHIAAGRADGFWEYGLQPWDTAAGAVICREAGARVTDIEGREWSPTANSGILVANPALHQAMLDLIRTTSAEIPADQ
ncbi:MAG: inositol monophosphatase family protein [Anaerosomatales bacterium]|nr:inositol monophosphatase family protein [Anaerosomatales bacterium]MDT8433592.1 inositol monophosphatase family protein [Anaerosomatales bacterium]